jgi:hypothetical protein
LPGGTIHRQLVLQEKMGKSKSEAFFLRFVVVENKMHPAGRAGDRLLLVIAHRQPLR